MPIGSDSTTTNQLNLLELVKAARKIGDIDGVDVQVESPAHGQLAFSRITVNDIPYGLIASQQQGAPIISFYQEKNDAPNSLPAPHEQTFTALYDAIGGIASIACAHYPEKAGEINASVNLTTHDPSMVESQIDTLHADNAAARAAALTLRHAQPQDRKPDNALALDAPRPAIGKWTDREQAAERGASEGQSR